VIAVSATDSISLDHCAGDYFLGNGLGFNCHLIINPKGTFDFQLSGCTGVSRHDLGRAWIENGVLKIFTTKWIEPDEQRSEGGPTDFFPVRWGSRFYLVAANAITDFCSEVNEASEPRITPIGGYYLRGQDWRKNVEGSPEVPASWRKYLLTNRVDGKITQLLASEEAWIDVGGESGLLPSMTLTANWQRPGLWVRVRVHEVERTRSRIKCEWPGRNLELGWRVSSRYRK